MFAPPAPRSLRDQRLIEGVASNLALFWGLSPQQVAGLARYCRILEARRGELIVERETAIPGVLALGYGTVKLSLCGANGEKRVVRLVTPGQTFGEATALLGRPSRYQARALADSKLVVIPVAPILELIDRDPRFARRMLVSLAERMFELLGEMESTAVLRGGQRLAAYLGSLAPREGNGECVVKLPASKTVIAGRLGMQKETLSRLLRRLSADGLIRVSRSSIAILDSARLRQAAEAQA